MVYRFVIVENFQFGIVRMNTKFKKVILVIEIFGSKDTNNYRENTIKKCKKMSDAQELAHNLRMCGRNVEAVCRTNWNSQK